MTKPISTRHKWGEPVRFQFKTERQCTRCPLVRVTRHEPGKLAWVEWWRDGDRVHSELTPLCDASLEVMA